MNPASPHELSTMTERQLRAYIRALQESGQDWTTPLGYFSEAGVDQQGFSSGVKRDKHSPWKRDRLVAKPQTQTIEWNLPDLKKRTDVQRVESLAKRFWDAIDKQPWEAELILKNLQSEYWKQGKPITFEMLKEISAELIKRAEIQNRTTR